MTLGEKIKSARKAKNLTQKQLADLISVKHNSVSDWERDRFKPDIDTIELLCGVLDLAPSYIMGTSSSINSRSTEEYGAGIGNLMKDSETMDMVLEYKNLDEKDKVAIRQIISSLSKKDRG